MKWVVSWSFEDQGGQETYEADSVTAAMQDWVVDMILEDLKPSDVVKLTISRPDVHLTRRPRPQK